MKKEISKNESDKQYNVLLVDDEISVRHLKEYLLKEMKYNIHASA